MKYMLLLRYPDGAGPQEATPEFDAEMATWGALNQELKESGAVITAAGLQPETAATTVRTREGETVLTAGRVLRPADVGLLAAIGVTQIAVTRRPRVA